MPHTNRSRSSVLLLTLLLSGILILFVTVFLIRHFPRTDASLNEQAEFDLFLSSVFSEEAASGVFTLHFLLENAECYGIDTSQLPHGLGTVSEEALLEYYRSADSLLAELTAFDRTLLDTGQQLTYDAMLWYYEAETGERPFISLYEPLTLMSGIQAQLPFLLSQFRFEKKDDVELYLNLLDSVYSCFESIIAWELEKFENGTGLPPQLCSAIAVQCKEIVNQPSGTNFLITGFADRLTKTEFLTEVEAATYIRLNAYQVETSLIPAYSLLLECMSEHADSSLLQTSSAENAGLGLTSLPTGKEYYELLARKASSSDLTVPEMKDLLNHWLTVSIEQMKAMVPTDSHGQITESDLLSFLESAMDAQYPADTPTDTICFLSEAIGSDFPSLPCIGSLKLSLCEVPSALRTTLGPALYLLSPLDSYLENTVYINPEYPDSDSFTTLAHETFPGHLYARLFFLSCEPHAVRSLLDFPGWDEGWATYAEHYAYGFAKNTLSSEFLRSSSISLLCLYGLTDIGIHYDGMNESDVASLWSIYGLSKESVSELYLMLAGEPAYYLPYSVGVLQMYELLNEVKTKTGDAFSLKEFHKQLLELGPLPFSICRNYLLSVSE